MILSRTGYDSFASGDNDWITRLVEYIRMLLQEQRRVRVLGVCFGHQIIGRALGVMPQRNEKGWEVSVTSIKLTVIGQQLFGPETLVSPVIPF
jgi:GMP synthase-like glutamine amidotransferase